MNRNKITASLCSIMLVGVSLFGLNVHAYDAPFAEAPPIIDGIADEAIWNAAAWQNIGHVIIDNTNQGPPDKNDFAGRFKVVWTSARLYLLAEITDDNFSDTHPNPLDNWWNDDTLEIFIDEDRSGGIHGGPDAKPEQEYNAFAYHIGIDNQVVDVGPNAQGEVTPQLYNEHIKAIWRRDSHAPHNIIWEVEISVFSDSWLPNHSTQVPVILTGGKILGFMVSAIDADGADREHFMGSIDIPSKQPHGKNWGWIDAGVFDELQLLKKRGG